VPVKPLLKYSILLLLLGFLTVSAAFLINNIFIIGFRTREVAIASSVFMIILFGVMAIFLRGQSKEPDSRVMHSLVAITIKFLLELIFVFFWFFVLKKSSLSSVILFFVLYLTFTLFLIIVILKTLKKR
jgi:hypothetical protein